MDIATIFDELPRRYKAGSASQAQTFYFSIDSHKYTVRVDPERAVVERGKTVDSADVVLKTTSKLFEKMVVQGKAPGPIDIARGKIKTNDPAGLAKLRQMFDFG